MTRVIFVLIFTLVATIGTTTVQAFEAGSSDLLWPNMNKWVCNIDSELQRRDEGKTYVRVSELISEAETIVNTRDMLQRNDDDTCRSYLPQNLHQGLKRILNHQGISENFALDLTTKAASEIADAGMGGGVMVCETQILTEDELSAQYSSYYYLKFGTVRAGKHLIVRLRTNWGK